jgi:hypothetical protein
MNSVNRAMGTRDLYPFALFPDVLVKLDFIHRLIQDTARDARNVGSFQRETAVRKKSQLPSEEVIENG